MVSTTEGWLTYTCWKRRSSAGSFSMCFRYSSCCAHDHQRWCLQCLIPIVGNRTGQRRSPEGNAGRLSGRTNRIIRTTLHALKYRSPCQVTAADCT